ncbi:uncharacterized protein F4807DRAFT_330046 [Annulohypoxylon truncatum]|uniref:uncharacterized protein n=1 Tax=Annulohypoxylon truncatum TaxID=327061 RepID=UPI002007FC84|nr:uncharacterized protein F4807DRAFT_330046 [Annulohypoxylon truncatum]KAI1204480.1 hypothetical protein F4807DRAFT_330046 [Annulohypoxylon truncatum]
MGSYISIAECQARYNVTLNCTVVGKNVTVDGENVTDRPFTRIGDYGKGEFPGDPDIAGIGILGVFVAVTSFAIATGIVSVTWQLLKTYHYKTTYTDKEKAARQPRTSFSEILETLILACSDQQVFTGAAYALTLRYWRGCTISAYHYNIVANMMLLTCATHLISVTIVRNYWKFRWLALLRVIAITGVFTVTGLLMANQNANTDITFPTGIPNANETDSDLLLAAACFQTNEHTVSDTFKETTSSAKTFFIDNLAQSTPHNKIQGWNLYIITMLFYGVAIIAEIIKFFRRGRSKPGMRAVIAKPFRRCCALGTPLRKFSQHIFLFYLVLGLGLGCATTIISTSYIFRLRSWVNNSGWIQIENNINPENDAKSFGQLVPIFSSALIVFSFAQMISEKLTEHNKRKHENEHPSSQAGTIQYFGPSSYDPIPPYLPEKGGTKEKGGWRYFKTTGISSTTSLPPRADLENQMGRDRDMNSGNHQVAIPLLSDNNYFSTVPTYGIRDPRYPREPRHSSSREYSPLRHDTTPPPSLPFAVRPHSHARGVSSTSSRGSYSPQSRSLMGSPNGSQQSIPRSGDTSRFSTRPSH